MECLRGFVVARKTLRVTAMEWMSKYHCLALLHLIRIYLFACNKATRRNYTFYMSIIIVNVQFKETQNKCSQSQGGA